MDESEKAPTAPFYGALKDALGQAGCPVCRLAADRADRYLSAILWEMVNDPSLREELNLARGYCREHGWMLVRAGAALGVAILTRDVIRTLLRELDTIPAAQDAPNERRGLRRVLGRKRTVEAAEQLAGRLSPQVPCPACVHVRSLECDYLNTLVEHLDGPGALDQLYGASDGLCLVHFCQGLELVPIRAGASSLAAAQRSVWQRLEDELGEFVRKNDYRFRDEEFGAERDAWLRALGAVSGPQPRMRSDLKDLS